MDPFQICLFVFIIGCFLFPFMFKLPAPPTPVLELQVTRSKPQPKEEPAEKYNKEDMAEAKQMLTEFGYSATEAKKMLMAALADNPASADDWVNIALRKVEL